MITIEEIRQEGVTVARHSNVTIEQEIICFRGMFVGVSDHFDEDMSGDMVSVSGGRPRIVAHGSQDVVETAIGFPENPVITDHWARKRPGRQDRWRSASR